MQCSGTFASMILCTCLSGSFEWDQRSNQSTEKSRTPSVMQDFIHSSRDLGWLKKSHRREFSLWLFQLGHRYFPALRLVLKHWLLLVLVHPNLILELTSLTFLALRPLYYIYNYSFSILRFPIYWLCIMGQIGEHDHMTQLHICYTNIYICI